MNWLKKFWKKLTAPPPNPARVLMPRSAISPGKPVQQPDDEFGLLTPRAKQALAFAHKEAERFLHTHIATEHVLLGLMRLERGVAVNVLKKLGLDLETARAQVEKQDGIGADAGTCLLEYTPGVKKVLADAAKEAKNFRHTYVGTEHILLGILSEHDGVPAAIFKDLGIDAEKVRQEIMTELTSAEQKPTGAIAAPSGEASISNFTPRAQQVLALARKEADRFNHNFVGTEHLLLGLVALGQGVAVNVLAKLGINLETVRAEVEKQIGKGPDQKMIGNIPYTPRVKKVLALADKERVALNHKYLGTEHILLGLIREGDGVAARILTHFGLELEKTREEFLKELDPAYNTQSSVSPEQHEASEKLAPPGGYSLTPRAQQALGFAHKEADRLFHTYIGTEHLLLGLIMLGQGVAVNVFKKLGLDLETARAQVEKRIGVGAQEGARGKLEYTPGVKKVFGQACKNAKDLNHTYVGTEHILLGLLSEKDGIPGDIFKEAGIDAEKARQEILRELTPAELTPAGPTPASARSGDVAVSNFTPHSQQALAFARREADRLHHNFVGTDHLFLGMMKLEDCTAVRVLRNMGVVLDTVRTEIEKQIGSAPDQIIIGNIPYTPRVKKVLALAAKESVALQHTYVGTEHILLGILREGDGIPARVLAALDIRLDDTRKEVLKELDPNKPSPAAKAAAPQSTSSTPMITSTLHQHVDTTARYDVFCREQPDKLVVYRNVVFKSVRSFFPRPDAPADWEYAELEQGDGKCVFVAKSSIVRFSPQDAAFEAEDI